MLQKEHDKSCLPCDDWRVGLVVGMAIFLKLFFMLLSNLLKLEFSVVTQINDFDEFFVVHLHIMIFQL